MEKNTQLNSQVLIYFGNHLRALRIEKGLTQEELAERADFTRSYYSEIETGKRNISLINLYYLSRALQVSLSTLVEFQKKEDE